MPLLRVLVKKDPVLRGRWLVGMAGILALVPKLAMAATTYGTNDTRHWQDFVLGVRQAGPIGIYGVKFPASLYNHPPLVGYFLEGVGAAGDLGLRSNFTIRALASLADVASALLAFELVRKRRGPREGALVGAFVAVSPVLFVISGFHNNTDPIFVLFTLVSVYLLADRQRPGLAGAAIAIALSIKIVPIVAVPALLVFAGRHGRKTVVRFCAGLALVVLVAWGPAVLLEWGPIKMNVLGYQGVGDSHWGLPQLGRWAGNTSMADWLKGPGRIVLLALSSGLPALFVWRRPGAVVEGVGVSLVGVLLLSPAFGTQYLVWAAAATLLLGLRIGVAYNLLAGALLIAVYNRWNGGIPWDRARAGPLTPRELLFGAVVWAVLLMAFCYGLRGIWLWPASIEPSKPLGTYGSRRRGQLNVIERT